MKIFKDACKTLSLRCTTPIWATSYQFASFIQTLKLQSASNTCGVKATLSFVFVHLPGVYLQDRIKSSFLQFTMGIVHIITLVSEIGGILITSSTNASGFRLSLQIHTKIFRLSRAVMAVALSENVACSLKCVLRLLQDVKPGRYPLTTGFKRSGRRSPVALTAPLWLFRLIWRVWGCEIEAMT